MDFLITEQELEALCGLSHIQQLAYLRGVRPYMDVKTAIVGVKRGISYQSIAEQLYTEPHQGIKSQSYSRAQIRRAISGLERAGLIQVQSLELKLILKCNLASGHYSVQNKAVTNPSHQAVMEPLSQVIENHENLSMRRGEPDTDKTAKAATPLKDNNYIYLLSQFEKFWSLYPEKKSKQQAWEVFKSLNPDPELFNQITHTLNAQIKYRQTMEVQGNWIPPWKYPVNWLMQRCWEDELPTEQIQEKRRASHRKNTGNECAKDMFWNPEAYEDEPSTSSNVIQFAGFTREAY